MTTEIPKGLYCYHAPIVTQTDGVPVITKRYCPHLACDITYCCEKYGKEIDDLCKCADCMIGEWKNDPNDHGKYFSWPNSGD